MKRLPDAALPSRGLLADYLAFASPLTDAPQPYHLGVGLVVLATLLGNRVSIPHGSNPLFPNLYVTLLGRSTFSRKTTSIGIGQRILRHFESAAVMPAEFSPEAFLERLERTPAAVLIYPELARALTAFRRDYMAGMVERLTELYDAPQTYTRELKGRSFTIKQPVLSILAASTMEWLQRTMGEDDVRGGFYPRFLFVPEGMRGSTMALPPPPDPHAETALVRGLSRLIHLHGEADLSGVRTGYERWFDRMVTSIYMQDDSEILSAFAGRLSVTVLKLALLYHVAETDNLTVSPEALERALALAGWLQEATGWLLQDGLSFSRWDKDRKRVLGLIQRRQGIPHSALLKASHSPARLLKEIANTLIEEGTVLAEQHSGVTHYYTLDSPIPARSP